jgi:hypothetical protein
MMIKHQHFIAELHNFRKEIKTLNIHFNVKFRSV